MQPAQPSALLLCQCRPVQQSPGARGLPVCRSTQQNAVRAPQEIANKENLTLLLILQKRK